MSTFRLAWANLMAYRLSSTLSVILLTLGIGMVSSVMTLSDQLADRFNKDIRGIDMVVGTKGSPLQLILSAVYQIDNPTGNIPLSEIDRLKKHPLVKYSIPLSFGDNYEGFRIVGTDTSYVSLYKAAFAVGRPWSSPLEVVLGASAADELKLLLGDHFHGTHGLAQEGEDHEEHEYVVVGILQPTGTVIDRLILTSTESVWELHRHEEESGHADEDEKQVTALLVKFKNPMGLMQLPRWINETTAMQAALPAIEMNRLYDLLGVGFAVIRAIGIILMIIAALSVFISLLNSLKDRKVELALMRSLGASPLLLFRLILQESLLLCMLGYLFGLIFGRIGMWSVSNLGNDQFHVNLNQMTVSPIEIWLFPITILVGVLASLIPAIGAYRTEISSVLKSDD